MHKLAPQRRTCYEGEKLIIPKLVDLTYKHITRGKPGKDNRKDLLLLQSQWMVTIMTKLGLVNSAFSLEFNIWA
jgi:hypothetical protein